MRPIMQHDRTVFCAYFNKASDKLEVLTPQTSEFISEAKRLIERHTKVQKNKMLVVSFNRIVERLIRARNVNDVHKIFTLQ